MTPDLTKERIAYLTQIPKVGRTKLRLPRFVPVIFGNGEDDDTLGLEACYLNWAFLMDGRIYEPGEDVVIEGKHLIFYRHIRAPRTARLVSIVNCRTEYRG